MKKFILLLCAVILVCLTACQKNKTSSYDPIFEVGKGYTLTEETISGTSIGEEYILLSSVFQTYENFIIFGDSSAETFLESGIIPLQEGKNNLIIRFYNEQKEEREYHLLIEYIPIRSLFVDIINPQKTYHIGEAFDKNSVRVTAETKKGQLITIDHYEADYAFSELGEQDVGIEVGDFYKNITVLVTEEYHPTLDGNFSADGVKYILKGDAAVLISAEYAEGFFAVPSSVIYEDKEYPVIELGNGAFSYTKLQSIQIPEGVQSISTAVFSGCEYLEEVTLPDTLTSIGRQAFSECRSLSRIELPEALKMLDYGTFFGCEALFRAVLPKQLQSIGEQAFFGCSSLKSIEFPSSLEHIGNEAFAGCSALESVILGNLKEIGKEAFKGCNSLSVFSTADVENLGEDIFSESKPIIYTAENSNLTRYAQEASLSFVIIGAEPYFLSTPKTFAIADEYPHSEFSALICLDGTITKLKNYEIDYPKDACGSLTLTIIWNDFQYTETIFISYTETILTDTDSRGVRYELDPINQTAILSYLPPYVKPSKVYRPETEGLLIVPTTLSSPDGEYRVIGVAENIPEGCENVSEIFIPAP